MYNLDRGDLQYLKIMPYKLQQKQLLYLVFIYNGRHDVSRRFVCRTRAVDVYTFIRERCNCVKYKNSLDYKGPFLLDSLPAAAKNIANMTDFNRHLNVIYNQYNDVLS